jgi:hypothetical protein
MKLLKPQTIMTDNGIYNIRFGRFIIMLDTSPRYLMIWVTNNKIKSLNHNFLFQNIKVSQINKLVSS